jgi:hypothetical protein
MNKTDQVFIALWWKCIGHVPVRWPFRTLPLL